MARDGFVADTFIGITAADGQTFVAWYRGAGAPTADAEIGSFYSDTTSGYLYRKATAGSGADKWSQIPSFSDLNSIAFRADVKAATGDAAPSFPAVIDLVATPFGDDDGTTLVAADFTQGDLIIFGVGGTPVLAEVTLVSGDEITVDTPSTGALVSGDNFVVANYLPDTGDPQEVQALVHYNGTAIIKLGDFNWALTTGINLSSGYVGTTNGTPAANDVLETAIGYLDANQRDLTTLSGVAQGAVDHGTFTGETIPDNSTTKAALQSLETELEGRTSQSAITAAVTLDSVLVDDKPGAKWLIVAFEDATPANKQAVEVFAIHNGTASADATATDYTIYAKLKSGSNFNMVIDVDVNGTGASQTMRLRVSSSSGGITATARRLSVY